MELNNERYLIAGLPVCKNCDREVRFWTYIVYSGYCPECHSPRPIWRRQYTIRHRWSQLPGQIHAYDAMRYHWS